MKDLDRFRAIAWVVRQRRVLPWAAAALPALGGLVFAYQLSAPMWVVAGVGCGVLLWGCVRLAVEVLDLIAETLLPR